MPDRIKPFDCHGADMRPPSGGSADWQGDCLLCGKDKHFFVAPGTGMYDCKSCGRQGNVITFLTEFVQTCRVGNTRRADFIRLSRNRGIPTGILRSRKLAWDGQRWLIPCFSDKGTVRDIRRFGGSKILSTAGCKTQLYGADRLAAAPQGTRVWLCEGEWDAMAMDWLIREAELPDVAVAVPGATVFKKEWVRLFTGKKIVSCYDADEAGDKGAMVAQKRLVGHDLSFVVWPDSRPKGWDLRDFVVQAMADGGAGQALSTLKLLISFSPRRKAEASSDGERAGDNGQALKLLSFEGVMRVFRKLIVVNGDTELALKVMLATCLSNDIGGDPLWVYIVGPAGAGKTMLLQAFQASDRCIFRSTVTPHCLVSGWKDGPDPSLVPKLSGLTFVIKDFTEILTLPEIAKDEIFSTLRGAHDRSVEKSFGNGVYRSYNLHSDPPFVGFSVLAGVTAAIHAHKKASLGERFVMLQLREPSRAQVEAVQMSALDSIGKEAEIEGALQEAVARFLSMKVDVDNLPPFIDRYRRRLSALVSLVSVLRAEVTRDRWDGGAIVYRPVPEIGTRLIKQLGKLAMCLALVEGKTTIDDGTYECVERVAMDSAHGFHLEVLGAVMDAGGRATKSEVCEALALPISTLSRRFEDLVILKALKVVGSRKTGGREAKMYGVPSNIERMWLAVKGEAECEETEKPSKSKSSTSTSARRRRRRSRKRAVR